MFYLQMNELLAENFAHLRQLSKNINARLNSDTVADRVIRNELAGMFAVTVVATYEGIVKATLMDYASKVHPKYFKYVERDFQKSNAKISGDDLKAHSIRFGLSAWEHPDAPKNATTYHRIIAELRPVVERRFRKDMMGSYTSLFQWRNAYAHERSTTATLLDVYESHRVAQYVVVSFVKAFEEG